MNNNNERSSARGMNFADGLLLAFIILKLCGVIDWAWVWVLAPLWMFFVIALVAAIICCVIEIARGDD